MPLLNDQADKSPILNGYMYHFIPLIHPSKQYPMLSYPEHELNEAKKRDLFSGSNVFSLNHMSHQMAFPTTRKTKNTQNRSQNRS